MCFKIFDDYCSHFLVLWTQEQEKIQKSYFKRWNDQLGNESQAYDYQKQKRIQ